MTDVHTKAQRSYNMSRVKSKNTKPEETIFKLLRTRGYRFKKHYQIYGKPDIAFPKLRIAIFIDGEFWHGKDFSQWKEKLTPFWFNKITGNIERDKSNKRLLRKEGWRSLRLWGRVIMKDPEKSLIKIVKLIEKHSQL